MSEGQCRAWSGITGVPVECEREFAHGGAHTATIYEQRADGKYIYKVSWWRDGEGEGDGE